MVCKKLTPLVSKRRIVSGFWTAGITRRLEVHDLADQKYHNHALEAWIAEHRPSWRIEVQARPAGTKSFTPLAKLWVIERTNAWQGRYRRNSKDYEHSIESSTAMIQISHIHLMLNRLTHYGRPVFHYRKDAANRVAVERKSFRIASKIACYKCELKHSALVFEHYLENLR